MLPARVSRAYGQVVHPDERAAEGVCRSHQGELAARVPSAGFTHSFFRINNVTGRRAARAMVIVAPIASWKSEPEGKAMLTRCVSPLKTQEEKNALPNYRRLDRGCHRSRFRRRPTRDTQAATCRHMGARLI